MWVLVVANCDLRATSSLNPLSTTCVEQQDANGRSDGRWFRRDFQQYHSTNEVLSGSIGSIAVLRKIFGDGLMFSVHPYGLTAWTGFPWAGISLPASYDNLSSSGGLFCHERVGSVASYASLNCEENYGTSLFSLYDLAVENRIRAAKPFEVSLKGWDDASIQCIHFPCYCTSASVRPIYESGKVEQSTVPVVGPSGSPKKLSRLMNLADSSARNSSAGMVILSVGTSDDPRRASESDDGACSEWRKRKQYKAGALPEARYVRISTGSPVVEWTDPTTGRSAYYVSEVDIDVSADNKNWVHVLGPSCFSESRLSAK